MTHDFFSSRWRHLQHTQIDARFPTVFLRDVKSGKLEKCDVFPIKAGTIFEQISCQEKLWFTCLEKAIQAEEFRLLHYSFHGRGEFSLFYRETIPEISNYKQYLAEWALYYLIEKIYLAAKYETEKRKKCETRPLLLQEIEEHLEELDNALAELYAYGAKEYNYTYLKEGLNRIVQEIAPIKDYCDQVDFYFANSRRENWKKNLFAQMALEILNPILGNKLSSAVIADITSCINISEDALDERMVRHLKRKLANRDNRILQKFFLRQCRGFDIPFFRKYFQKTPF